MARDTILFWGSGAESDMSTMELTELIQLHHEKVLGLRNLCIYFVYVVWFLALAFSTQGDPELAGMPGKGMRTIFEGGRWTDPNATGQNSSLNHLQDVNDIPSFFQWMKQVFVPAVWGDQDPDGTCYIGGNNRVIRSPRLMQIRSAANWSLCEVFSEHTLTTPYDPNSMCNGQGEGSYFGFKGINSDPFSQDGGPTFMATQDGDKFIQVFQIFDTPIPDCGECGITCCERIYNMQDALTRIDYISSSNWISQSTQWLALHIDVQNAVAQSFGHMRLVFAFEPSGVIEPAASAFLSWNAWYGTIYFSYQTSRFITDGDYVLLAIEVVMACVTIVNIILVLADPVNLIFSQGFVIWWRCSAAAGTWDGYDLFTYSTVLVNMVLRFAVTGMLMPWTKMTNLDSTSPTDYMYTIVPISHFTSAVIMLLLTVRTFKFFHLHPRFGFITRTMTFARNELINYFLVFGTIVTGFTVTGWYFWGHGTSEYRGFVESMKSVLTFSLGQFSMEDLRPVDTSFGLMLFIFYFVLLFLVYFVLINIFMAIIINGYNTAVIVQQRQSVRIPSTKSRTFWLPLVNKRYPSEREILKRMISAEIVEKILPFPALPAGMFLLPDGRLRILFRVGRSLPCLDDDSDDSKPVLLNVQLPLAVPTNPKAKVALISIFKSDFQVLSVPVHVTAHDFCLAFSRNVVRTWLGSRVIMEVIHIIGETPIEGLLGTFELQLTSRGYPILKPTRGPMDTGPVQEFTLSRHISETGAVVARETLRVNELRALLTGGPEPHFDPDLIDETVASASKRFARAQGAVDELMRKESGGEDKRLEEMYRCFDELKHAADKVDALSQRLYLLDELSQP